MNKPHKGPNGPCQRDGWWRRNWFYAVLILIAIIGSLCAFYLPLHISEPFSAGDSVAALRQAILAATGGVLAMLTLWENRRKNLQEKDKNDLDHARQVKAERRSRYAKAIEQLADDKAPIRRGGIYTLTKLADEWLADNKTVPTKEERLSEGQVIIDSLCAYIRSSYPLSIHKKVLERSHEPVDYPGNFLLDQAKFREEQEVRQLIIKEITKRLMMIPHLKTVNQRGHRKGLGPILFTTSLKQHSFTWSILKILSSIKMQFLIAQNLFTVQILIIRTLSNLPTLKIQDFLVRQALPEVQNS